MSITWLNLTEVQKRLFIGALFFFTSFIAMLGHVIGGVKFPGMVFSIFALPTISFLPEYIINYIGKTGAVVYFSIVWAIFSASFAAPIKSRLTRVIRNILATFLIIWGLMFGVLAFAHFSH